MTRTLTPNFRSIHQQRVDLFMLGARQKLPLIPTPLDVEDARLRIRLIFEELLETADAAGLSIVVRNEEMGTSVALNTGMVGQPHADYVLMEVGPFNLVEFIDGCADLSVVVAGSFSAAGVADEPILAAVDNNNLMKFAPGHSWRADGKLIKPPQHPDVRPEIARILEELRTGRYVIVA